MMMKIDALITGHLNVNLLFWPWLTDKRLKLLTALFDAKSALLFFICVSFHGPYCCDYCIDFLCCYLTFR